MAVDRRPPDRSLHLDLDLTAVVMDRTLTSTITVDISQVPLTPEEVVDWIVDGIEDMLAGALGQRLRHLHLRFGRTHLPVHDYGTGRAGESQVAPQP